MGAVHDRFSLLLGGKTNGVCTTERNVVGVCSTKLARGF